MDFTTITVEILKKLAEFSGNYGLAIILLTIIIRLILWPLSISQQRSMKKMQVLSPKLKAIQDQYKSNPQMLQQKMMEFQKEHKFNPLGGCLPLLLQLPIFILLYQALMSTQFNVLAGNSSFLFIKQLDAPMQSHAGVKNDGTFSVNENDKFATEKVAKVYLKGNEVKEIKVIHPDKAIEIQGELLPGEPVDFKIQLDSLKASFEELDKIEKVQISVTDKSTKEIEKIDFVRRDNLLVAQIPTEKSETVFHYDVLFLVLLFGVSMYFSQKIMMATNQQTAMDANQQAMQKSMANIMPIMITATFVFVPIPAGVLLYMVASNIIQVAQTILINKQLEAEESKEKKPGSNLTS